MHNLNCLLQQLASAKLDFGSWAASPPCSTALRWSRVTLVPAPGTVLHDLYLETAWGAFDAITVIKGVGELEPKDLLGATELRAIRELRDEKGRPADGPA